MEITQGRQSEPYDPGLDLKRPLTVWTSPTPSGCLRPRGPAASLQPPRLPVEDAQAMGRVLRPRASGSDQYCVGPSQKDPWSPICLSLLLSLPNRYVRQQVPSTRTLLYLDDRSIVSPSVQDMERAQHAWNEVEQVSRLRTHAGKTQVLGRTEAGQAELGRQGFEVRGSAEVLGVSVGPVPRDRSKEEVKREAHVGASSAGGDARDRVGAAGGTGPRLRSPSPPTIRSLVLRTTAQCLLLEAGPFRRHPGVRVRRQQQ